MKSPVFVKIVYFLDGISQEYKTSGFAQRQDNRFFLEYCYNSTPYELEVSESRVLVRSLDTLEGYTLSIDLNSTLSSYLEMPNRSLRANVFKEKIKLRHEVDGVCFDLFLGYKLESEQHSLRIMCKLEEI